MCIHTVHHSRAQLNWNVGRGQCPWTGLDLPSGLCFGACACAACTGHARVVRTQLRSLSPLGCKTHCDAWAGQVLSKSLRNVCVLTSLRHAIGAPGVACAAIAVHLHGMHHSYRAQTSTGFSIVHGYVHDWSAVFPCCTQKAYPTTVYLLSIPAFATHALQRHVTQQHDMGAPLQHDMGVPRIKPSWAQTHHDGRPADRPR